MRLKPKFCLYLHLDLRDCVCRSVSPSVCCLKSVKTKVLDTFFECLCVGWVLHIAKVGSIPSPYLRNVEEQKS